MGHDGHVQQVLGPSASKVGSDPKDPTKYSTALDPASPRHLGQCTFTTSETSAYTKHETPKAKVLFLFGDGQLADGPCRGVCMNVQSQAFLRINCLTCMKGTGRLPHQGSALIMTEIYLCHTNTERNASGMHVPKCYYPRQDPGSNPSHKPLMERKTIHPLGLCNLL